METTKNLHIVDYTKEGQVYSINPYFISAKKFADSGIEFAIESKETFIYTMDNGIADNNYELFTLKGVNGRFTGVMPVIVNGEMFPTMFIPFKEELASKLSK